MNAVKTSMASLFEQLLDPAIAPTPTRFTSRCAKPLCAVGRV